MGKMEGVTFACLTAIMWGFLPLLLKAGLLAFSGSFITSVRLLGSFAILVLYIKLRGERLPLRPFPRLAILGGFGLSANYLLFIYGLDLTTAISAEIIIQMAIILMVLTGVLILKEEMNMAKALGTILSMLGVWVIVWNGADLLNILRSSSFVGNLMIVASAVSWPAYGYTQVVLNRNLSSSHGLILIFLPASIITLLAFPTFKASSIGSGELLILGLLVAFAVIPYASLARSFKSIESSTAVAITTLAALVTPLGVFLLRFFGAPFVGGENITIFTVIGGTLILLGILVAVKGRF